jgi:hypothetical protein
LLLLGGDRAFLLVPGAGDHEHVLAEVDVTPTEAAKLAAAQARQRCRPPQAALLVGQRLDQLSRLLRRGDPLTASVGDGQAEVRRRIE